MKNFSPSSVTQVIQNSTHRKNSPSLTRWWVLVGLESYCISTSGQPARLLPLLLLGGFPRGAPHRQCSARWGATTPTPIPTPIPIPTRVGVQTAHLETGKLFVWLLLWLLLWLFGSWVWSEARINTRAGAILALYCSSASGGLLYSFILEAKKKPLVMHLFPRRQCTTHTTQSPHLALSVCQVTPVAPGISNVVQHMLGIGIDQFCPSLPQWVHHEVNKGYLCTGKGRW